MSPLLLHSNTNQYNINGLLCTYTEMFRIQTCCNHILSAAEGFQGQEATSADRNFCQFYLVLSLFYSLKRGSNGFIAEKTLLILTKDPEAVHYIPGGCTTFSRGGGPNAYFYRIPYTYLLFSRGCPDPLSSSGSAHGQCQHNGTIFITVRIRTIIVRH